MGQVGGRRHFSLAREGDSGWLSWQGSQVSIPGCKRRKNPSRCSVPSSQPTHYGSPGQSSRPAHCCSSVFSCHCFHSTMFSHCISKKQMELPTDGFVSVISAVRKFEPLGIHRCLSLSKIVWFQGIFISVLLGTLWVVLCKIWESISDQI